MTTIYVTIYLSYEEDFIITAYKTSKVDKIVKRGVIWKK